PMGVSRRGLEDNRDADLSISDLSLCGRVSAIKAPHEAHVEKDAASPDRLVNLAGLVERNRQRLLTEYGFGGLDRVERDVSMGVGGSHDRDRVDFFIREQIVVIRVPCRHAMFGRK